MYPIANEKISEYLTEAYQAMVTLENDVNKLHEIDDLKNQPSM